MNGEPIFNLARYDVADNKTIHIILTMNLNKEVLIIFIILYALLHPSEKIQLKISSGISLGIFEKKSGKFDDYINNKFYVRYYSIGNNIPSEIGVNYRYNRNLKFVFNSGYNFGFNKITDYFESELYLTYTKKKSSYIPFFLGIELNTDKKVSYFLGSGIMLGILLKTIEKYKISSKTDNTFNVEIFIKGRSYFFNRQAQDLEYTLVRNYYPGFGVYFNNGISFKIKNFNLNFEVKFTTLSLIEKNIIYKFSRVDGTKIKSNVLQENEMIWENKYKKKILPFRGGEQYSSFMFLISLSVNFGRK